MTSIKPFSAKPNNASRLATIRRLYFYLIAFISLVVGLLSLQSLLEILFDVWLNTTSMATVNNANYIRETVARDGGLLLVATPIFLIHWAYMQGIARHQRSDSAEERSATLRKLFLYSAAGFTLVIAVLRVLTLLSESGIALLGGGSSWLTWPGDWLSTLLSGLIHLAFLAYFVRQLVLDGDLGHERHWAGTLRRIFQTLVGLAGLGMLLGGASSLLELGVRTVLEGLVESPLLQTTSGWWVRGLSDDVARMLVGALLWRINWLRWDLLIARYDEEARTALRRFYLYAATVLSAGWALVPAAGLFNRLLLRLFGVAPSSELADLAAPLAMLPIGLIVWRWHWVQVNNEANRYGYTPESANIRRLYYYLVAAVGLVLLWIGLVDILRGLLDWLVIGSDALSRSFRAEQLANGISMLAVGAPVWAIHWRAVQSAARAQGPSAQAERTSGPRRAYLYGVALVGALLILFEFATVIYRLLLLLLGDANADLFGTETIDSLVRSGTAIVFWIVHVLAIRGDTRLTEAAGEAEPIAEAIVDRRALLEERITRLEEELADARAELAAMDG
ncbi:MAG: hypothetical protein KF893_27275 [Caldilineaceae bacterium]|nr:hypothetical protein [Caldilineaceae bacterium]